MTVTEIYDTIEVLAPFRLAAAFDNVGLLVGDEQQVVKKVLVALDMTDEVLQEAVQKGVDLIITHHPILFQATKTMLSDSIAYQLVKHGISHIAAHTNLDIALGGINDKLARICGLQKPRIVDVTDEIDGCRYGFGLIGELKEESSPQSYAEYVKNAIGCEGARVAYGNRPIKTVAVNSGGGASLIETVFALGADAFITSDLKYNHFLDAVKLGVTLIDAGHFETENIIVEPLAERLQRCVSDVEFLVSDVKASVIRFI